MKLELTRRGSYAIRAAIALARIDGDSVTSASRIAAAMGIPPRFLPQVMGDLVRAGIVEGVVGRGGGYRLARDPGRISLLEVIKAAEGDTRRRTCVLRGVECGVQSSTCDVHGVFAAAQTALLMELDGTSIADVLAQAEPAVAGQDLVEGHPA
ncbi:MAG: Rrf2 family transcriptional regulator [Chloroflexota bacterium]